MSNNKSTLPSIDPNDKEWFLVDAKDQVLGRLAARIAVILMGKHKPTYVPFMDNGDFVVITNAEKVKVSQGKEEEMVYRHHTLYPGGLKEIPFKRMMAEHPERILESAIRRMLPKTKLAKQMIKKLHIYKGTDHPHGAQNPTTITLTERVKV